MNGEASQWKSPQLRDFGAQFRSNPALCERALAVLGGPAPEPERVMIRTDSRALQEFVERGSKEA